MLMSKQAAKRQEAKGKREKQWGWIAPKLENQILNNHRLWWSHCYRNTNDHYILLLERNASLVFQICKCAERNIPPNYSLSIVRLELSICSIPKYFFIFPPRFYTLCSLWTFPPNFYLLFSWLWWTHPICSSPAKSVYYPEKGELLKCACFDY